MGRKERWLVGRDGGNPGSQGPWPHSLRPAEKRVGSTELESHAVAWLLRVGQSLLSTGEAGLGNPSRIRRTPILLATPMPPISNQRLLLQCITNSARERKINSSLQLPDRVLNFLKDHFLMDGQVRGRMLLLQPKARYQHVTVHRVPALNRTYDVLFLGTGACPLQAGWGSRGHGRQALHRA